MWRSVTLLCIYVAVNLGLSSAFVSKLDRNSLQAFKTRSLSLTDNRFHISMASDNRVSSLQRTETSIGAGKTNSVSPSFTSPDVSMFTELNKQLPDIPIPFEKIAERDRIDREWEANRPPSARSINEQTIREHVKQWQRHDGDCGSPEVQIVASHQRIQHLTKHLLANRFDFAAKRGINAIVNKRRRLLNYLYMHGERARALELVTALGIRFHPPDRQWDRLVKYKAFKNTKQGKK